jgi:hypothetical protein
MTRLACHYRRGLLAAALALPAAAAPAATSGLAELAITTDDNVSNAREGRPAATEQAVQGALVVNWSAPLTEALALRLAGRAEGVLHARFTGLNGGTGTAQATLLLRTGRAFASPVLGLSLAAARSETGSALRDASEWRGRLTARLPLTTRVTTRLGIGLVQREAANAAFDTAFVGGEAGADWQATDALGVALGYEFRDGDVVSLGTPNAAARDNARALAADDVFTGQTALRFDARTHIGTLTLTRTLAPGVALDAQLRYVESTSNIDARYQRLTALTGLLLRF